jgi:catechol 2,3-dioxygenase-like lactoylglutathione lyase family enzyme
MITKITHVPILVSDQKEALEWFTTKLGFEVKANDPFPDNPEHFWITVAPPQQADLEIVLQPPLWGPEGEPDERARMIGKQPGFVMMSTDCRADCEELKARGVKVVDEPMEMPWGVSALFADLYGNVHNILEPRAME